MRIPIIAGNWKMNTTVSEAADLAAAMKKKLNRISRVETVFCPPFVSLTTVKEVIKGTSIKLGAQNLYFEKSGAYTGEVSPTMLQGLCDYVIIGHSERRALFGETDQSVNMKIKAAIKAGIAPIICVGESLEQYEAGETIEVVVKQIKAAFEGMDSPHNSVIAYEPIWAIGTGKAARGDQANAVSKVIRSTIAQLYGDQTAIDVRIQYGGSVTGGNVVEFLGQLEIDGALVGGASLKSEEFLTIVEKTAELN